MIGIAPEHHSKREDKLDGCPYQVLPSSSTNFESSETAPETDRNGSLTQSELREMMPGDVSHSSEI
jgi:hypothetical protein